MMYFNKFSFNKHNIINAVVDVISFYLFLICFHLLLVFCIFYLCPCAVPVIGRTAVVPAH